jgi:hypothetical protein
LVSSGASPIGPIGLDGAGVATYSLPIPDNTSIAGSSVLVQAFALDMSMAAGFSTSNALEILVGN